MGQNLRPAYVVTVLAFMAGKDHKKAPQEIAGLCALNQPRFT
jgi:hypothetical protein